MAASHGRVGAGIVWVQAEIVYAPAAMSALDGSRLRAGSYASLGMTGALSDSDWSSLSTDS